MEWALALLVLVVVAVLSGAIRAAWHGREQPPPLLAPRREPPGGKLAYTDQLLVECVTRARDRLRMLERLDARLRKRASSLACTAKR
jgi:hypothetical protein